MRAGASFGELAEWAESRNEVDAERRYVRSHAERGNEISLGVRREKILEVEFLGKRAQKMTKVEPQSSLRQ
jgi:hypothetical protein